MMRLFVAFDVPDDVASEAARLQSGLRGARWRPVENFHVTLAFVGDVDPPAMRDLILALGVVRADPFPVRLGAVGAFGGSNPHTLWLAAEGGDALHALHHEGGDALHALHHKVESACRRAGLRTDARKYEPHMTLAYLKGSSAADVAAYAAHVGAFKSRSFTVDRFHLYSSHPGHGATVYHREHAFSLHGHNAWDFDHLKDGFF